MEIITRITLRGSRALIVSDAGEKGWIRKSTLAETGWQEGDPLNEEAWEAVMRGAECRAAVDEGARYLASPRSRAEVEHKLLSRGYREDVVREACDRLEEYGYIRDEDYARMSVEAYASRGEGKRRVQQRLLHKGISREVAQAAVEELDEEQERRNAVREAEKLMRGYASLDAQTAKRRLTAALLRRGFSWDTVSQALAETIHKDAEDPWE